MPDPKYSLGDLVFLQVIGKGTKFRVVAWRYSNDKNAWKYRLLNRTDPEAREYYKDKTYKATVDACPWTYEDDLRPFPLEDLTNLIDLND